MFILLLQYNPKNWHNVKVRPHLQPNFVPNLVACKTGHLYATAQRSVASISVDESLDITRCVLFLKRRFVSFQYTRLNYTLYCKEVVSLLSKQNRQLMPDGLVRRLGLVAGRWRVACISSILSCFVVVFAILSGIHFMLSNQFEFSLRQLFTYCDSF